jgi:hypothetical protein
MIKNLIKIAAELDAKGFAKEADIVDLIIRRVAQTIVTDYDPGLGLSNEERSNIFGGTEFGGQPMSEEEHDFHGGHGSVELTEEDIMAMSKQAERDDEDPDWREWYDSKTEPEGR